MVISHDAGSKEEIMLGLRLIVASFLCLLVSALASAFSRRYIAGFSVGVLVAVGYGMINEVPIKYLVPWFILWNALSIAGGVFGWALREGRTRIAALSGLWGLVSIELLCLFVLTQVMRSINELVFGVSLLFGTIVLGAITVFALPRD
jgi:hypothetical protein